jgi:hypothetical protein
VSVREVEDFDEGESLEDASFSNRLIDQVLPEELDWVELVRTYPIPALAVAAIAGFFIGRIHGERLIEAASDIADRRVRETADRLASAAEGALD